MGAGDACPPHDEDDAQVVKLVAEPVHVGAVVREGVEDGGEGEADDHAEVVDGYGGDVCGAHAILGECLEAEELREPVKEQ